MVEAGDDGLYGEMHDGGVRGVYRFGGVGWHADETCRTYVNPPYEYGAVIRWVRHYGHTDFIFLLRWDPSTDWFAELTPKCWGFWFANERVAFDPPPRIRTSSNPYPHALFLAREPTGEFLDRLLANGYLVRNVGFGKPRDRVVGTGTAAPEGTRGGGDGAGGRRTGPTLAELTAQARRIASDENYALQHPSAWRRPPG